MFTFYWLGRQLTPRHLLTWELTNTRNAYATSETMTRSNHVVPSYQLKSIMFPPPHPPPPPPPPSYPSYLIDKTINNRRRKEKIRVKTPVEEVLKCTNSPEIQGAIETPTRTTAVATAALLGSWRAIFNATRRSKY